MDLYEFMSEVSFIDIIKKGIIDINVEFLILLDKFVIFL